MPIPKPNSGESQEDFVSRCHSALADEYTDPKQRHVICMDSWRGDKKSKGRGEGQGVGGEKQGDGGVDICRCPSCGYEMKHNRNNPCANITCPECGESKMIGINKTQKARKIEGYESPEPGDIPEKEKQILASTYASCRKDGGDKEKCSKIAWAAVKNARKEKSKFLTGIKKSLGGLDKMIKNLEALEIHKGFLTEIPNQLLNIFSEKGQSKFKEVYIENRRAGINKSDSLELSTNIVSKIYYNNSMVILKGIEKVLKDVVKKVKERQEELLGDQQAIEDIEFEEKEEVK